jgi:uncharacterized repeat protein (TIGR03803 family)
MKSHARKSIRTRDQLRSLLAPIFLPTVALIVFLKFVDVTLFAEEPASHTAASSAIYKTIHNFCSTKFSCNVSGAGQLVQGLDGNLYAAGFGGIVNSTCSTGCGVVVKMTPQGIITPIYEFCSQANCTDGIYPSGLILGNDGNFYGVTIAGGLPSNINSNCPQGCGTVFKLTPQGTLTTLYSLDPSAGYYAVQVIQGVNGNFYVHSFTDPFDDAEDNVFSMTQTGSVTSLAGLDWAYMSLAFQGTDGTVYGATTPTCDQYCQAMGGTLFAMTPEGAITNFFNFCPAETNCTNGASPSSMLRGADGNFYGTTYLGGILSTENYSGCNYGCGTAYKVTPAGDLTTLYDFCAEAKCLDGAYPISLLQANNGNFYGITYDNGGTYQSGTIFEITSQGAITTIYNFCSLHDCTDGIAPEGMVQGTDGTFYGTTSEGGAHGDGVVFNLSVGLEPFIRTLPTYGKAGTQIQIYGNHLIGTTAVSFKGTPATFTVESDTDISAMVPEGATSGTVKVTTPSGTLSSSVEFLLRWVGTASD